MKSTKLYYGEDTSATYFSLFFALSPLSMGDSPVTVPCPPCVQHATVLVWATPKRTKVKASVLNKIISRVNSEEELKYARLGLEIFKTQNIDLKTKSATLFVKVSYVVQ